MKVPTSNAREVKNPAVSLPIDVANSPIKNPSSFRASEDQSGQPPEPELLLRELHRRRLQPPGAQRRLCRGPEARWHRLQPAADHGGVGLGKTHLAHAIGIEIERNHPDKTILYVPAEKFTHQFIEAVKNNTVNDFSQFYQMMDVLMSSTTMQFLAGKERPRTSSSTSSTTCTRPASRS